MRPDTAAVLHRINLDFYECFADRFSATRAAPWPGWRRVASTVEESRGGRATGLSVLDLGCGNGRLAASLERRWENGLGYLGIDASAALLDLAAARGLRGDCWFLRRDLFFEGWPAELPGAPFDLIAVFGLMHHLPGLDNRRALLRDAAGLLAPGGHLAVSFWQFGDRERFRRRVVGWEEYNRTAEETVDVSDLEPGDTLLAWGQADPRKLDSVPVRYCCWTPRPEADRLLAGLDLEVVSDFSADGREGDLNLYRVLRAGV